MPGGLSHQHRAIPAERHAVRVGVADDLFLPGPDRPLFCVAWRGIRRLVARLCLRQAVRRPDSDHADHDDDLRRSMVRKRRSLRAEQCRSDVCHPVVHYRNDQQEHHLRLHQPGGFGHDRLFGLEPPVRPVHGLHGIARLSASLRHGRPSALLLIAMSPPAFGGGVATREVLRQPRSRGAAPGVALLAV